MTRIIWNSIITGVVALGTVLSGSSAALAQWSSSISQGEIIRPWEQHLVVLQSFSESISTLADVQGSVQLSENLATLESDVGEFGLEVEEFIYRLAGDPQFVYVAAQKSQALSTRLAKVHTQFLSLYQALGVQEREDAITAQASLEALREALHAKTKFENDVTNALGSGARQVIMALANRWWNGKLKSEEVMKFAANLRQQLDGVTTSEEQK